MKILVNALTAKKNAGGAFQIAQNFLNQTIKEKKIEWFYFVSKDLDDVLDPFFDRKKNVDYFVFPTQPDFRKTYKNVAKRIRILEERINPDVVYSITAPSYFSFKSKEVMRFTNPWVTHPNDFSWMTLSLKDRLKKKVYCFIQRYLMRKCSYFITQTETTKNGILKITKLPPENVCVVNNVLPAAYKNFEKNHFIDKSFIDVACIGNPNPHKNIDIISDVLVELKKKGVTNVRFHTTIPKGDLLNEKILKILKRENLECNWINHGRISQQELGGVYQTCSLCFFPSLLEVFSASILEAMYFNLPIVASDFSFNKDVLENACLYFEPRNAESAASQIIKLIIDASLQKELKERMENRLKLYGDYDRHFNEIVTFLKMVASL